jgi:CBS domain-containing protein
MIMRSGRQDFVVVKNGNPVGVVHARDIRSVEHSAWDSTTVGRIATPIERVQTVEANDDAYRVLQKLARPGAGSFALVLDNGQVQGAVRHEDILRWIELQSEDRTAAPGAPVFGR